MRPGVPERAHARRQRGPRPVEVARNLSPNLGDRMLTAHWQGVPSSSASCCRRTSNWTSRLCLKPKPWRLAINSVRSLARPTRASWTWPRSGRGRRDAPSSIPAPGRPWLAERATPDHPGQCSLSEVGPTPFAKDTPARLKAVRRGAGQLISANNVASKSGEISCRYRHRGKRTPADVSVSWPAIIAGAFVAAAFTLLLLALGAGLGFSVVSPWRGAPDITSTKAATVGGTSWP